MTSREIIDEGHQIWRQNWKVEVASFLILGIITLVFVFPIALIIGLSGTDNQDGVYWFLVGLLAYLIFLNISMVVSMVQIIDRSSKMKEEMTSSDVIYTLTSKVPRLMVLSLVYFIIIGTPASLVLFNTHQFYIDNILLSILYGGLYLVFMVIFGIPWFFCVRSITFKDEPIFSSIVTSWKLFYSNFEKIFPPALIAVLPVFILGVILFVLGLTLPEGGLLALWIVLMLLDILALGLFIMPWSLNITYPLFDFLEEEIKIEA